MSEEKENIKINISIDGVDLLATAAMIVGGFTGNWLPLLWVFLLIILMAMAKRDEY